MKNLEYICMAVIFAVAGISAAMWVGEGVHTWIWQVNLMIWVGLAFIYKKRLDKYTNE